MLPKTHLPLPLVLLALVLAAEGSEQWVHSPDISASVDTATGLLASINTSSGFSTRALGAFAGSLLAGQDLSPTISAVTVAPCTFNGLPALCMSSTYQVLGEASNASCCQSYAVQVEQALWPLAGLPGPVPSALGWHVSLASAAPQPWRTLLQTRLDFGGGPSSDPLYWAPQGGLRAAWWMLAWRAMAWPMCHSSLRPRAQCPRTATMTLLAAPSAPRSSQRPWPWRPPSTARCGA